VDPRLFYGPCRPDSRSVLVPISTLTKLCEYDPSRVVLIIGVAGVNAMQVAPRRTLLQTTGITLGVNGQSYLAMTFGEYGPLVGLEWYANGAAATVAEVIEVFRDVDPERRLGAAPEV
jgi:hypothetical protein